MHSLRRGALRPIEKGLQASRARFCLGIVLDITLGKKIIDPAGIQRLQDEIVHIHDEPAVRFFPG
jgi:hypothetical protein